MKLTRFEVLAAVLRLKGDAYGLRIRDDLETRYGQMVSSGAIYTLLDRMRDKGWVTSYQTEPEPVRGGRRRTVYRLTNDGHKAMIEHEAELRTSLATVGAAVNAMGDGWST